jgi:uncharacterized protein (DUF362 family)/NAD-dependent dihydropyrimidine dehydrogenase PreA subunit
MNKKSLVALVRCDNYGSKDVEVAVEKGVLLLGGPSRFLKRNERILLKPNILMATPPERNVTTHPSIVKAVGDICLNYGVDLSVGDSPGMEKNLSFALEKTGLADVIQALKIEIADFDTGTIVDFPEGALVKQFTIAQGVLDSDGLISIPKFKTHNLTRLTGAIKNQLGCIPGRLKNKMHSRFPDANLFSGMLVDLTRLLKPRLYIVDGIVAMEGNGPSSGQSKPLNVLLFSEDPVALDATMCRMVGVKPEHIFTLQWGEKLGLGNYSAERIELIGESILSFQDFTFDVQRKRNFAEIVSATRIPILSNTFNNLTKSRPIINKTLCAKCGLCVEICPSTPKGIRFQVDNQSRRLVYRYEHCIRCYCCQEICPKGAITVQPSLLDRFFHRQ